MSKLQKTFVKNVLLHLGGKPKLWLANEIGMNSGSLATSISEDGNATLKTVEKISDALKVSPPRLLGGSDEGAINIPQDILEMLEGQSSGVYDAIRAILKTIDLEKKSKDRSQADRK